jgi:hypothetical protein
MISTFTCRHCGRQLPKDPRIKKQKYCSSRPCQNARRYTTNKVRTGKRPESRTLRQARNKRWRDTYPAHEYQKRYRENHPEYVDHNRELQRERNKKRKNELPPMIVKTYALSPQPLQDGVYRGFEVKSGKIVKTYALMAQMQVQTGVDASLPLKPG